MRIVLDACVPVPFRHEITGHEVVTARSLGLSRLEDRALMEAIEGKFDVLVTCDRSLPWQNEFRGRAIALVVLRARTNKLADLIPLAAELLHVLRDVKPGQVYLVGKTT